MLSNPETLLCRYHYDPLDRLVDSAPSASSNTRRFYLKDRLATEIQGTVQRSIVQHDDQLLAQQQWQSGVVETDLLATDQQRSVLNVLGATRLNPLAYAPYGHRPAENSLLSLLGFNGERPDPVTGCYLLGNGYRAFNPVLMRFNSPDSWSPFGEGGLNGYAYCVGDPVNREDSTGHAGWLTKTFKIIRGKLTSSRAKKVNISKSSDLTEPFSGTYTKKEITKTQLENSPNQAKFEHPEISRPNKNLNSQVDELHTKITAAAITQRQNNIRLTTSISISSTDPGEREVFRDVTETLILQPPDIRKQNPGNLPLTIKSIRTNQELH
jgi:RHS repeat-associated protein